MKKPTAPPSSFRFSPAEQQFLSGEKEDMMKARDVYAAAEQRFVGAVRGLVAAHGLLAPGVDWGLAQDCSKVERIVKKEETSVPVVAPESSQK